MLEGCNLYINRINNILKKIIKIKNNKEIIKY